jgi:hypothetical protein
VDAAKSVNDSYRAAHDWVKAAKRENTQLKSATIANIQRLFAETICPNVVLPVKGKFSPIKADLLENLSLEQLEDLEAGLEEKKYKMDNPVSAFTAQKTAEYWQNFSSINHVFGKYLRIPVA